MEGQGLPHTFIAFRRSQQEENHNSLAFDEAQKLRGPRSKEFLKAGFKELGIDIEAGVLEKAVEEFDGIPG
ncbi:MAG: hypothetical protein QXT53_02745 [Ignisphaera sp.]